MKVTRVDLGNKIYDEIDEKMRKNYENCCILYIDKIENDGLSEKYERFKEELIKKRGEDQVKEEYFFHGTKKTSIDGICNTGFKMALNKVCAYGIGTYFSPNVKLALNYTDTSVGDKSFLDGVEVSYVFYCKVLIGKMKKGHSNEKIDTEKIDVCVNNVKSPTIYSIPYDDAIVPLYVVAFYKKAI